MGVLTYLDPILVPFSLFLTIGYHVYLWHIFKNNPHLTTIGFNTLRRRMWVLNIIEDDDDKKEMLAAQSIRNALMGSILAASIAVFLNTSLAAITNNTYNASHILNDTFFSSQSSLTIALKYASGSLSLLTSFLCSSMALGCLNDVVFLINVSNFPPGYVQAMLERGFLFAFAGNRALYVTFPLLSWMLGPIPMALSSVAMVWVLYELDFGGNGLKEESPGSSKCSM